MLAALGFVMIACFLYLIMSRRVAPVIALILVPSLFGLIVAPDQLGDMFLEGFETLAPIAAMLFFAIVFFGTMSQVGLFDPAIRRIIRFVGHDPLRLVVGTALLTCLVSLDGDGTTTFIIVVAALLPIYRKLGVRPVILTVVAATSNGVLNTTPWAGTTVLAASALNVSPVTVFVSMIPSILGGVVAVVVLAYLLGRVERRRLRTVAETVSVGSGGTSAATGDIPDLEEHLDRPHARPKLLWVNFALVVAAIGVLVSGLVDPPALVMMIAASVALILNFPRTKDQAEQILTHATNIVPVIGLVFAASMVIGVLSGSGMLEAMANTIITALPDSFGPHLPLVAGLLSIPFGFLASNPAYFVGILPVLAEAAASYGIPAEEIAAAALVGQPLHMSSPIVPSFLLLVGLARVDIGSHHKKALWLATVVGLVMLVVGGLTGAFRF